MPGGAPNEDGPGGQPTSPLTAVLPDEAMRLWTTVAATDAGVPTGWPGTGGTGGSVVDGSPCDKSIGFEEHKLLQRRPAALPTSERN